ncbi:hypothetical protein BC833DRAFT_569910 [Globomyces pollinis-pini]|nr:hypothetical protein BC833DRAFT_569910 [Globomyces pollinis-pini]
MHTPVTYHPEFQVSSLPYSIYGVIRAESGVLTVFPANGTEASYLEQKRKDLIVLMNRGKERRLRLVELPPLINHSCPSDQSAEVKIDCPEAEASKPGYVDRTWVANEDRADMEIEDEIAQQNDMTSHFSSLLEQRNQEIDRQHGVADLRTVIPRQRTFLNWNLMVDLFCIQDFYPNPRIG